MRCFGGKELSKSTIYFWESGVSYECPELANAKKIYLEGPSLLPKAHS